MKTTTRAKRAQVEITAIRGRRRTAAPCVAGRTKNRIAVAAIRGTFEDVSDINDTGDIPVNHHRPGIFADPVNAQPEKTLLFRDRLFQRQIPAGKAAGIPLLALCFECIAQGRAVDVPAVGQATHIVAVIAVKQNADMQLCTVFEIGDHLFQSFVNHI